MIIKEYKQLENIETQITNFYKETSYVPNVFFSIEWMKSWKEYFGTKYNELYLLFYLNKKMIGFCPLIYKSKLLSSNRNFKILGHGKSSYLDLPVLEKYKEEVYDSIFEHFQRKKYGSLIEFHDISNNKIDYYHLSKLMSRKTSKKFELYDCPYSTITGNWEGFFNNHYQKAKKRTELRKFVNRLDEVGKVEFVIVDSSITYDAFFEYIDTLKDIHYKRFKSTLNTSKFSNDKFFEFYKKIIKKFSETANIHLSILMIDKKPISFLLGFIQNDILIDYIPAFDPAFSKFSLGHIHLYYLLKNLNEQSKIKTFDFSKGDGAYKQKWADSHFKNYRFTFVMKKNIGVLFRYSIGNLYYNIKLLGRRKGYNSKLKNILGNKNKNKSKVVIEKLEITSRVDFLNHSVDFAYFLIHDLEEGIKIFILEKIYKNLEIKLVYENSILISIIIFEQTSETYEYYKLVYNNGK